MNNLLGLGVFGTFGQPHGFQQAFNHDIEFNQSLDLDNEEIALFPGSELFSVKREYVNGIYSIAFCLYSHAREMNANRNGTFIGTAIVLQQVFVDPTTIYKLLRELHDDVSNNPQNLHNNTIQVKQAVNLIVREPALFQSVKYRAKTIENTPYFSTKVTHGKKYFIHANVDDAAAQVIRFFDEALRSYKQAETLYFTFSSKIAHYVAKKAAIETINWEEFTGYRDVKPAPGESIPKEVIAPAVEKPVKPESATDFSAKLGTPLDPLTAPPAGVAGEDMQKMVEEYNQLVAHSKQMRAKLDGLLQTNAQKQAAPPEPKVELTPIPAPAPAQIQDPVPEPPKPEPIPVPVPSPKPDPVPEPPKPEPLPVPVPEPRPVPVPEPPKPDPLPVPVPEPNPVPAPAPPKPEPLPVPLPEPKPIPVPEPPKPEPKPEPKPIPKPEPKPAPKPEPKPQPAPAPKPQPAPAPKPTPKPTPPPPAPKPVPQAAPVPQQLTADLLARPLADASNKGKDRFEQEVSTPFYKKKGVLIGGILLVLLAAGGGYYFSTHSSRQETPAIAASDTSSAALSHDVASSGATTAQPDTVKHIDPALAETPAQEVAKQPEPPVAKTEEKKPEPAPAVEKKADAPVAKPVVAKKTATVAKEPSQSTVKGKEQALPTGNGLNPLPNGELEESEIAGLNQFGVKNMLLSELTTMIFQKYPKRVGEVYKHQAKEYAALLMQANKGAFKSSPAGIICSADAIHHIPAYRK